MGSTRNSASTDIDAQVSRRPLSISEFGNGIRSIHSSEARSRFPCGAGRGVALVDPRGDLWPCHRFGPHQCGGQFCLGKLGGPFNDRLRSVFLKYNVLEDAKTDCAHCPAVLSCRSWCYAECVDSTRTLSRPRSGVLPGGPNPLRGGYPRPRLPEVAPP